ncbi:MAG: response regulator [Deltaproteobacteria bacterium]|nr:response regulator [Deltaproteobacteria bacterium]
MSKSIFLVEDENLQRTVLVALLENSGYNVESSANAEECIYRLGRQSYDLLLTDIMLPGMNGLDLLAFVKEKLSFMPVMMMTGLNDLSSAVAALRLGADDYLCKPFKNEELLLRIRCCLEISDLKDKLERDETFERRAVECSRELDEVRSALKVVLKKSEQVKEEVEHNIASTIHALILPLISELELSLVKQPPGTINCLQVLKQTLSKVTVPFARSITSIDYSLTPREIQIANFIRMGKTSKEIAQLAKIAYATVESHRDTIRKKLGIKNRKISLTSFLISIER